MNDNPLRKLESLGQSIWLDYIRRDLIPSGELQRSFDEDIQSMAIEGTNFKTIYETLSQVDVQNAADVIRPM